MAVVGQTELEAVNAVLLEGGYKRVTAVPATEDGSPAREAKNTLNDVRVTTLLEGWGRVMLNKSLAREGDNTIRVDATGANAALGSLLAVQPSGADRHRSVSLFYDGTNTVLYDADLDSITFAASLTADVMPADTFDKLTPGLRQLVTARAKRTFQRQQRGDNVRDGVLAAEVLALEQTIPKYPVNGSQRPVVPMVPTSAAALRLAGSQQER